MDITQLTKQLGIDDMPEDQKQEMTAQIAAMLQVRINLRLSQLLTDEQLQQLEDAKSDEAALQELERLVPNYQQVVQDEIEDMLRELSPTK